MKQLLILLLIITSFNTKAQNTDSAWIRENYTKKEVYIPMRDGIRLFTAVYIPKNNSEAHPILMTRTPYSCQPYGEEYFRDFWDSYQKEYFKEGYIMVIQDVRGRWMSEGI
jgi:predicted acyl esterase